jgi:hypothetical protein
MRWYSPRLAVWISVDPVRFAGGDTRLYGFQGENPVDSTDPTGLWKISRDSSESFASAVAEEGDTFAKLGAIIGLDPTVFDKWVSLSGPRVGIQLANGGTEPLRKIKPDTKIKCDETVYIPNTVMALWFGVPDVRGKPIGKSLVAWGRNINHLKNLGFHVLEYDVRGRQDASSEVLELFAVLTRTKQLHGVYAWGHGYVPDKATGESGWTDGRSFSLHYSDIALALNYKLGLVLINACFGAKGETALSSGTTGSKFYGFKGVLIPGIQDTYTWRLIKPGEQGTNPKAPKIPPLKPVTVHGSG